MLGITFSTARHLLIKKIVYECLGKKQKFKCIRCKLPIKTSDEYHIDHINGWREQSRPAQAFFDLSNVGISHALCNMIDSQNRKAAISKKSKED